jgi:ferredoxin
MEIPTNRIAYEQGLGEVNIGKIEVLGEVPTINNFKWPPNLSYTLEMIPAPLARGLMKFWWTRPAINPEKCNQCKKCQESCPTNALRKPEQLADDQKSYIPEFDYDDCINCLCCMEMCPQKAVYQNKSLLYKVTSRVSGSD